MKIKNESENEDEILTVCFILLVVGWDVLEDACSTQRFAPLSVHVRFEAELQEVLLVHLSTQEELHIVAHVPELRAQG